MERLGTIVHRVLAGLTVTNEEEAGGTAVAAVPPLARGPGGENPGARNGDRHPITSTRRIAKRATGVADTKSMKR